MYNDFKNFLIKIKIKVSLFLKKYYLKKYLSNYNSIYLKNKNKKNKTNLISKYKKIIICTEDANIKLLKSFIFYHFKIGIDEIYIMSDKRKILSKRTINSLKKKRKSLVVFKKNSIKFEQDKEINFLFKKAIYKRKRFIIFPLDVDEFLFSDKNVYLDKYTQNLKLKVFHINFYQSKASKNFQIKNYNYRPKKFDLDKSLNFKEDYNFIRYVSEKILFIKNDKFAYITKGNHNFLSKKKYRNFLSNEIFLLHAKIYSRKAILEREKFEKRRCLTRVNNYESLTSKYFNQISKNKNKFNMIWDLNSWKKQNKKDMILDYSLNSCLKKKN